MYYSFANETVIGFFNIWNINYYSLLTSKGTTFWERFEYYFFDVKIDGQHRGVRFYKRTPSRPLNAVDRAAVRRDHVRSKMSNLSKN